MSKLRVALVGCGVIARQHLVGYARSSRATISALVDVRPDNAASLAKDVDGNPKVRDLNDCY